MSELSVGSLSGLAANSYVIDVASGSSLDLSNGATLPAGSILQVVSTTKTDTFTASLSAGSFTAITGLTATITPSSTNSKILILANVSGGHDSTAGRGQRYRLERGGSAIGVGDAAGSRVRNTFTGSDSSKTDRQVDSVGMTFEDAPSSTSSLTYGIGISTESTLSSTVYVNRGELDDDTVNTGRFVSTITVMEVAG